MPAIASVTVYRRVLIVLAAVTIGAQAVAFLSVNVGFPHFLDGGKPTLAEALRHLGTAPGKPRPRFLREAARSIGAGAVLLVTADRSGLSPFVRVEAAYDLFPHTVYFGRGGSVQANVDRARRDGARYVILVRRKKHAPWPRLRDTYDLEQAHCCRLARIRAQ
jgi:hypothetical protein